MYVAKLKPLALVSAKLFFLQSKKLRMIWSGHMGLTLLHSERPKLHTILAFLSAIGLFRDVDSLF